jgi:hypothetical protein
MALGAIAAAFAGWISLLAVTLLGWLSVPEVAISEPVRLAARLWLLAHGVEITIAGQVISIAPLGFVVLWVFLGSAIADLATRHSLAAPPTEEQRSLQTARLGAMYAVTYLGCVLVVSVLLEGGIQWRGIAGAALLALVTAVLGVGRACRWRLTLLPSWLKLPVWLRALPQVLFTGVLSALAGGALLLVVALLASHERFLTLYDTLQPGAIGGVLLLIIQLAWWPNLVLWATSWVAGAGFGLGVGTFITPLANQSGMLPNLPVFAVIPETGTTSPWQVLWLLLPVLAGVVAGFTMLRTLQAEMPLQTLTISGVMRVQLGVVRPDIAAIAGGFSGVATGLGVVALAALSGGNLGTVRLIGLGPLLSGLLILAPTTMGLSGLLTAALIGLRTFNRQRPPVENGTVTVPEYATLDDTNKGA